MAHSLSRFYYSGSKGASVVDTEQGKHVKSLRVAITASATRGHPGCWKSRGKESVLVTAAIKGKGKVCFVALTQGAQHGSTRSFPVDTSLDRARRVFGWYIIIKTVKIHGSH